MQDAHIRSADCARRSCLRLDHACSGLGSCLVFLAADARRTFSAFRAALCEMPRRTSRPGRKASSSSTKVWQGSEISRKDGKRVQQTDYSCGKGRQAAHATTGSVGRPWGTSGGRRTPTRPRQSPARRAASTTCASRRHGSSALSVTCAQTAAHQGEQGVQAVHPAGGVVLDVLGPLAGARHVVALARRHNVADVQRADVPLVVHELPPVRHDTSRCPPSELLHAFRPARQQARQDAAHLLLELWRMATRPSWLTAA